MRGRSGLDQWRRSAGRNQDALQDAPVLCRDLFVRETEDAEALGGEPGTAGDVMFRVVEGAVGLHDQAVMQADEVNDVRADWDLSTELDPVQPAVAQQVPEEAFGVMTRGVEVCEPEGSSRVWSFSAELLRSG
jgi:hypothetical protein